MSPSSIGLNTVLSFQEALLNGTAFTFRQYCWLHTARYTWQINWFELGNSTRKRFDENHFLLSRRSRAEHMKSEKCQSCFSRQKFTLWFTSLQVKQVDHSRFKTGFHMIADDRRGSWIANRWSQTIAKRVVSIQSETIANDRRADCCIHYGQCQNYTRVVLAGKSN